MVERKAQEEYVDRRFGFPILLRNVPMVRVRGAWTPDVDYNELARAVLKALSEKPARLTGHEVRFIRLHHELTFQQFAEQFGVTHQAVMKWERREDDWTRMHWSTEKDIRLWLVLRMNGRGVEARLGKVYRGLKQEIARRINPLRETTAFSCRNREVVAVAQ